MSDWLTKNKLRVSLYGLAVLNILVWSFYFSLPDGKLHLKVYDIGQGDAIFVETAGGYKVLIDGGPDNKVLDHLGKDVPFYSRKIDLLVLTHPQSDHVTGLVEVIKRYQINHLWINGMAVESRVSKEWDKIINEKGLNTRVVRQGDRMVFPDKTEFKVLWPLQGVVNSDPNAHSIVLHLVFGQFDAYLTGDADAQVQPYTVNPGHIEFFKVPHHGGKGALREDYVAALSPQVSVISVGSKNPYGHPRGEVLDILAKTGSKVYRTDKWGTVEIVSDGNSWYTNSQR
ncbi:MAG: MBL fold metallo-hydrolase [Candidatus Woykebacteria bacterium]